MLRSGGVLLRLRSVFTERAGPTAAERGAGHRVEGHVCTTFRFDLFHGAGMRTQPPPLAHAVAGIFQMSQLLCQKGQAVQQRRGGSGETGERGKEGTKG
jgi:hypothetical protein